MVIDLVDRLILFFAFCGCAWFVWRYLAADLPDDFLIISKKKSMKQKSKEVSDGGLRDNR